LNALNIEGYSASKMEGFYSDKKQSELRQICKDREIPSGGDKQDIIDRLIKDDLEKIDLQKSQENTEDKRATKNSERLPKEKKQQGKAEVPQNIDERVTELLSGMGFQSLEFIAGSFPGFFELSPEKQIYILIKMRQNVDFDIDLNSKLRNEEEIKNTKGVKKIWSSIIKSFRQPKIKEKILLEIKEEGYVRYTESFNGLIKHMQNLPYDVRYISDKGKLEPVFNYTELSVENQKAGLPKFLFNKIASRLAEIPPSWSSSSATSEQREIYTKIKKEYDKQKALLLDYLKDSLLDSDDTVEERYQKEREIISQISQIECAINLQRQISFNPEVEKDSAKFAEKLMGADVNKKLQFLLYTGAGMATKKFLKNAEFLYSGLGVSAVFGGFMAWRKKKLEYEEKELRQRHGVNVEDKGVKKYINAEEATSKLSIVINELEKGENKKGILRDKQKTLESLKNRLFVLDQMLREGRINFGTTENRIKNQLKLFETISEATNMVYFAGAFDEDKTMEGKVFDRFLNYIGDARAQREKRKAYIKSISLGAGLGLVGFGTGWLAQEYGGQVISYLKTNIWDGFSPGGKGVIPPIIPKETDDSLNIKPDSLRTGIINEPPSADIFEEKADTDGLENNSQESKTSEEAIKEDEQKKPIERQKEVEKTKPKALSEESRIKREYYEEAQRRQAEFDKYVKDKVENEGYTYTTTSTGDTLSKEIKVDDNILRPGPNNPEVEKNEPESENKNPRVDKEMVKSINVTIPSEFKDLAEGKFGKIKNIDGNIIYFENGKIGFYEDSIDQNLAYQKARFYARANGFVAPIDQFSPPASDGKWRVIYVYENKDLPLENNLSNPEIENNSPRVNENTTQKGPEEPNILEKEPVSSAKEISKTSQASIYEFDSSKAIKGKVRFLYGPNGEVERLEVSKNFNVRGDGKWNRFMRDDWKNVSGDFGWDKKDIGNSMRKLVQMKTMLSEGGFEAGSPEENYLTTESQKLEARYKPLIAKEVVKFSA